MRFKLNLSRFPPRNRVKNVLFFSKVPYAFKVHHFKKVGSTLRLVGFFPKTWFSISNFFWPRKCHFRLWVAILSIFGHFWAFLAVFAHFLRPSKRPYLNLLHEKRSKSSLFLRNPHNNFMVIVLKTGAGLPFSRLFLQRAVFYTECLIVKKSKLLFLTLFSLFRPFLAFFDHFSLFWPFLSFLTIFSLFRPFLAFCDQV